jgi:rhamnosyl/mannosyltransferase
VKVLQLTKFYPPVHGGIETATQELADGLNARGVPTDVLCAHTGRWTQVEHRGASTLTRAGSLAFVLSTSMSPAMVRHLARARGRYDLLHVHLPNPMANVAVRLAGWPGKVVVHWHSDIVNQQRALRYYEPLQTWLLQRADAIIATSAPYAEHSPWLQPWRHKLHIVPLGIDVRHPLADPAERDAARAALDRELGTAPLVLGIGRMAGYKGFEHLVEAAAHLRPDARVVVIGGGALLADRRERVREAGLEHRIEFPGRLSNAEVEAYLERAQVFCMPSINRAEAFGMVLLEAMAARLPIVATDIAASGVPWVNVHGETGWNVPVEDPIALADAINGLLDDPARAKALGENGRRRLETHFTADRMVERTLEVYERVMAGR